MLLNSFSKICKCDISIQCFTNVWQFLKYVHMNILNKEKPKQWYITSTVWEHKAESWPAPLIGHIPVSLSVPSGEEQHVHSSLS